MLCQQYLGSVAEILIAGGPGALGAAGQALASAASQIIADHKEREDEHEFQLILRECNRVRALLAQAGEYYTGLVQVLAVQSAGYASSGSARGPLKCVGNKIELRG